MRDRGGSGATRGPRDRGVRPILAFLLAAPGVLWAVAPASAADVWNGAGAALIGGSVSAATRAGSDGWTPIDFGKATCNSISPPMALSFSLPPQFVTRDPNHGAGSGCFWGTPDDLDRVFSSEPNLNFEQLGRGVFQARLSTNAAYDPTADKFQGEAEMANVLLGSGVVDGRITRRKFGKHPGLIVTGKVPNGSDLYMLYLAHTVGEKVLLINYRPATPAVAADRIVWRKFLDSIHGTN